MLILHVALSKKFDQAAFVWAEEDAKDRTPGKRHSLWPWLAGTREYPYQSDRNRLSAALPEDVRRMGRWRWATAWLPSDEAGPLPSGERIAPLSMRHAEELAPWGVLTLMASAGCLHLLLLASRGQAIKEWQFGADGTFWRRVYEFAGALVVQQQFLPGVTQARGQWFAEWWPSYGEDVRKQVEQLAQAMPVAARALNWDPGRAPEDTPYWLVDRLITRLVGSLVKWAQVQSQVWEKAPEGAGRRRGRSLEERWLEALLLPGTEIKESKREMMAFALEIGEWRKPLIRLPKAELGDEIPSICLPREGRGFWEGGPFPAPVECPEMPRKAAAILERVGEFPNWCGERPMRDTLEPVYEAASRYALEHVFGRK